jgi:hypothetical protein
MDFIALAASLNWNHIVLIVTGLFRLTCLEESSILWTMDQQWEGWAVWGSEWEMGCGWAAGGAGMWDRSRPGAGLRKPWSKGCEVRWAEEPSWECGHYRGWMLVWVFVWESVCECVSMWWCECVRVWVCDGVSVWECECACVSVCWQGQDQSGGKISLARMGSVQMKSCGTGDSC